MRSKLFKVSLNREENGMLIHAFGEWSGTVYARNAEDACRIVERDMLNAQRDGVGPRVVLATHKSGERACRHVSL